MNTNSQDQGNQSTESTFSSSTEDAGSQNITAVPEKKQSLKINVDEDSRGKKKNT